ncbi:type IV secretion system protein VirB3 [Propionivibrio sp.]|uniref:type IV secretion system protein VirB3 n=1 Tax=Propionivibrio sp. TaxID=2212460 RepID=UPI0039E280AF
MEKGRKLTAIDPLFKGCTRPAMLLGVPMIPMMVVCMAIFLPGMWVLLFAGPIGLVLIFGVLPGCVWWMREVTKKDDYRLEQLILRLSLRIRQVNGALWGKGVAAYSPIQYRRRWR